MHKKLTMLALAGALVMVFGSSSAAPPLPNVLVNPGFEDGMTGWTPFNNAFYEGANPPQFTPRNGNGMVSMFGNWWGVFNVSGIFQEFSTTAGETWEMYSSARYWSGDPMTADGVDDNWVVQKIAFFDASNAEIGGVDLTILNGTFPPDVWHDAATITGVAPAGTVKLQALILYLQPMWDGGAAHIDDVSLVHVVPVKTEPTTWGKVKSLYR